MEFVDDSLHWQCFVDVSGALIKAQVIVQDNSELFEALHHPSSFIVSAGVG